MVNRENEIEEIIVKELCSKYGLKNPNKLIKYIILRFLSITSPFKVNLKENKNEFIIKLGYYILDELCICVTEYKDVKINMNNHSENSLFNIIENLIFRYDITRYSFNNGNQIIGAIEFEVSREWDQIKKESAIKAKKFKGLVEYNHYLIYERLNILKEQFKLQDANEVSEIDGFIQDLEIGYLTMEEKCESYIKAAEFSGKSNSFINEKQLEDYLVLNLEKIEEGLKFVSRQFIIPEGRIDILARDKNGQDVILELKVVEDKELIWQLSYYPSAYSNNKNIRVIAICPSYSNHMLMALSNLKNVELIQYKCKISNRKIMEIEFKQVNN